MNLKILLLCSFVCLVSIHGKAVTNSADPSTVYAVTWNVGEENPPKQNSLRELLGQISSSDVNPDIVIVGLQEVTMNLAKAAKNAVVGDKWTEEIDKLLKNNNDYHKVHSESLVGLLLNVYVKIKYKDAITEKKANVVKTGFKGTVGNKGAVILKYKLNNRWYCIVNSHLPAHDDKVEDRIDDYKIINKERGKLCNTASDYMFWLGDLNFRLDEKLDDKTIREKINQRKFDELLKQDQLKVNKETQEIFTNFKEKEITFPPTFKLEKGKGTYSSQRRPAWTDRVLYKSETAKTITPTLYSSIQNYKESDHYPVQAQFFIKQQ
uniref:Putative inositol-145-triphosphate 5-phosphatase synaptojanin inp51/inp52/inp53 family n=1 Tax=Rhodnius neglectus TaxID=72488 RepID=A0A0P4VLY1_9HEMI